MTVSLTSLRNPICVALDAPDRNLVMGLANELRDHVGAVKIGLTSFAAGGPDMVSELATAGPVFLDLKFHDIPAQVAGAVRRAADLGAHLTTVHASGGRAMLEAAAAAAEERVRVLGVTLLTSLDADDVAGIGMSGSPLDAVLRLAELAVSSGLQGLVCSPREVAPIRERFGSHTEGGPYLVVPGIRAIGSETGDQRRTAGPAEALAAGADLLVVGRPITGAPDPVRATRELSSTL